MIGDRTVLCCPLITDLCLLWFSVVPLSQIWVCYGSLLVPAISRVTSRGLEFTVRKSVCDSKKCLKKPGMLVNVLNQQQSQLSNELCLASCQILGYRTHLYEAQTLGEAVSSALYDKP